MNCKCTPAHAPPHQTIDTNNCALDLSATKCRGQNTWQIVPTNTTLSLLGLQCLGADTLIVFGEDGILLKSMDGGETFSTKQNISASVYTAAYFKNVDTGFAGSGYGSLLGTVNGGSNWTFTGTCTCFITGICFSDDQHGIFGGTAGVYRTVDGGASWFESTNIPYFVPNRIAAFQDSVFVAIYGASFYRSSDYGTIWSKDTVNSYSNYSLSGLSFLMSSMDLQFPATVIYLLLLTWASPGVFGCNRYQQCFNIIVY